MSDNFIMGILCVTLFGCGSVFFALQLCSKSDYLRLDYDGFTVCSLHVQHHISWAAVECFFPYVAYRHNMVGWRYRPDYLARSGMSVNRRLTQVEGATPSTYGMKAEKLAALMNELCLCYQLASHYRQATTTDAGDNQAYVRKAYKN